jgi:hypothetical protein
MVVSAGGGRIPVSLAYARSARLAEVPGGTLCRVEWASGGVAEGR